VKNPSSNKIEKQDNLKNVINTFKSESPIRKSLKNSENNLNMNTE
jgi:hypothetical protein